MQGILLTAISSIPDSKPILEHTVKVFEELGHKVSDEVLTIKTQPSPGEGEQELLTRYRKINQQVKNADFIIAEISQPSSGVGYLVAQAVTERKPVLALMKSSSDRKPPLPFQAGSTRLITFKEYSSNQDIAAIAKDFINIVKDIADTKFILIISPQIDKYLEWAAAERRQHKAQIVRDSVEQVMSKDKEYQEFLKSQA